MGKVPSRWLLLSHICEFGFIKSKLTGYLSLWVYIYIYIFHLKVSVDFMSKSDFFLTHINMTNCFIDCLKLRRVNGEVKGWGVVKLNLNGTKSYAVKSSFILNMKCGIQIESTFFYEVVSSCRLCFSAYTSVAVTRISIVHCTFFLLSFHFKEEWKWPTVTFITSTSLIRRENK